MGAACRCWYKSYESCLNDCGKCCVECIECTEPSSNPPSSDPHQGYGGDDNVLPAAAIVICAMD